MFSSRILAVTVVALIFVGAGCTSAMGTPDAGTPAPSAVQKTPPAALEKPTPPHGPTTAPVEVSYNNVIIKDFAFTPAEITIKKGMAVTWQNQDSAPHVIVSDSGLPGLQSAKLENGGSYTYIFYKVGDWAYHCQIHPNMKGVVKVVE